MAYGSMIDLALTPEEQADSGMPSGVLDESKGPVYPWGTRITFGTAEMEKLGLDVSDVSIGDVIDLRAFGSITSISTNRNVDGTDCCRVEICLEKISVESEMDE